MKQYSLQRDEDGNHTLLFRGEDGFGTLPNNQEQMDYAARTLKDLKVNPEYIGWLQMYAQFEQTRNDRWQPVAPIKQQLTIFDS